MDLERISSDMKKYIVNRKILLPLMCLLLFLNSCVSSIFEYTGEYPELFTVAVSSILGARGYESVGRTYDPARIEVLEEDDFGRVLFSYWENTIESHITGYSYIIMQKTNGGYVYYYPYYNFIFRDFPDNDIELFKSTNSWNQEMSDDSAFEGVKISRNKETGPIPWSHLFDTYYKIFPYSKLERRHVATTVEFLRADSYGRTIYFTSGFKDDGTEIYIAILFKSDHGFDIESGVLEITDPSNYQTELRLFMEANGWNTPP